MRRNDAKWRQLLRRASKRNLKPILESVEDRLLLTTYTVTTNVDSVTDLTAKSLRNAIILSNANPGTNIINFDIAASGIQSIAITAPLPTITVPVTIDGTTERGFSGTPIIELNGTGAGSGADGLDIAAGKSTVRGLVIDRFTRDGISLTASGGNTITNNYIGTISLGTSVLANGLDGILIGAGSNNNTISNNLISGNKGNGINVDGTSGGSGTTTTSGNTIVGNLIGVNVSGTGILPNGGLGISVKNAPTTTIGGTGNFQRNIISGNSGGLALFASSDGSVIQGNYIGTNISGLAPLGNGPNGNGISIEGIANSLIGGTDVGAGNLISGNRGDGINGNAFGGSNITIQGNFIGTNRSGNVALNNGGDGINIPFVDNLQIGGAISTGASNVVSSNLGGGINAGFSTGLVIQGNFVGTDLTGTINLGNVGTGVTTTFSPGTLIGGATADFGNTIAYNGSQTLFPDGVLVSSIGTSILSNSIFSNTGVGIDFFGGGGANNYPFPVLTSAVSAGTTSTISGTFAATPGTYTLQFFSNPPGVLNGTGTADGQIFLGSVTYNQIDVISNFTLPVPAGFSAGDVITATATDPLGNTSAFSDSIVGTGFGPLNLAPTISATSTPSTVPSGSIITTTFTISNPSTVSDTGVGFTAPIPSGTTFFSGTTSIGAPVVVTGGSANVSIGTLGAGQTVTISIILTTGAGSVPNFSFTGNVTSFGPTVNLGDDIATVTSTVTTSTDLYSFINGPMTPVPVGQNISYQVTVGNNGPSTATGVILLDAIPGGTTFVSASSSDGSVPTFANGMVTSNIGTLTGGTGDIRVITIVVATNGNTPASINDYSYVAGNESDSDPSNNGAVANTTIVPSADLGITSETVTPGQVLAGQVVTFAFQVINNGPSPATNVVLSDTLPAGLIFLSGTAAGGPVTFANGVVFAPVGTLASGAMSFVTIQAMTASAGLVSDAAAIMSDDADPNPNNNTSSATVSVSPLTDLAVTLSGPASPFTTGETLTYSAVVTNNGPSAATNVVLTDPLFSGAQFLSALASNGTVGSVINGVLTVPIGTLASGQSITITITLIPTLVGTVTNTVTITGTEPDSNLNNNSASLITSLAAPQFFIGFTSPTYTALETDGFAPITLVRTGSTQGEVTVRFSTVPGGNAVAGVNYQPVSMIVTFPAGVSQVTVNVPVLADPYDALNEFVDLQLDSPSTGAVLQGGAVALSAVLQIINIDPLLVGPTVTEFKLIGTANAITGIEVDTTGKLNPITAGLVGNYTITSLGGGKNAIPAGQIIPITQAVYNALTGAILLFPSSPLPSGQLFQIKINGTQLGAVSDLAGNSLNSVVGLVGGSDFVLTFARGTTLNYTDQNGARVTLKITGPGTLDLNRAANGLVERLQVVGPVSRKTVLTGSTVKNKHTTIGSVVGLKRFGTVTTHLPTPPFTVTNTIYPNLQTLDNGTAPDTLIGSSGSGGKIKKVKAKAIVSSTKHPHGVKVHAAQVHSTPKTTR